MHKVTLIPGDGIGPEVIRAAIDVVNATGVEIHWKTAFVGEKALVHFGGTLPAETLQSIRRNKIALKGPCDTPIGGGFSSVNVALRKEFGLIANIRPVKSIPGLQTRYENVDLVIFREGVGGVYGGTEKEFFGGEVIQITGMVTRANYLKFFHQVFNYALKHERKRVTIVHKANIFKKYSGLFLKTGREVAEFYHQLLKDRGIVVDDLIVDNAAHRLVQDPTRFGILAMNNEHGDILSDMCSAFVGGLGVAPGANIGDRCAIFEAVHGTAPDIAGKGIANPTAMILSAAMMLEYMDEHVAAKLIRESVEFAIRTKSVTRDLDRENGLSTEEFTKVLTDRIKQVLVT